MTDGVRKYILETSNIEREEVIAFGNVEVQIVKPLPDDVSLAKVLHMISGLLPRNYYRGITKIQVDDHPKFANKEFNAMYQDGTLYVSPDQDNEEDMIDDIIHETAHHLEVVALSELYEDQKIINEFRKKRRELKYELATEGYDVKDYSRRTNFRNRQALYILFHKVKGDPRCYGLFRYRPTWRGSWTGRRIWLWQINRCTWGYARFRCKWSRCWGPN